MKSSDAIRLFGLNNLSVEAELRRIESELNIDFGHRKKKGWAVVNDYYPQFTERMRNEAAEMASHYAIFYCLENFIRELIIQRLEEVYGDDWWLKGVPDQVRHNCENNKKRESSTGHTLRSSELIDYSTFGELGEVIKANWETFGDMFRDSKAVEKILASLNALRAPIAHCKSLSEDEVLRLHLLLRDWFRQME